jgi:hypothetical protein
MVWTRTFYPGVVLPESASEITTRPGREVSGIEMKFLAVPSHGLRGVVVNPDGTSAARTAITLSEGPAPRRPSMPSPPLHAETNADGSFEFPQVVDGEWRLAADLETGAQKLSATQWVDVAGHDLQELKLRLAPQFTVRGHESIETPQGMPVPDPFPVFLVPHTRPVHSDTGLSNWMRWPLFHFELPIPLSGPDSARLKEQIETVTTFQMKEQGAIVARPRSIGSFDFENVYAGSYRIASMTPPPPYYMAAIRVGESELTAAELELSSSTGPITIVYKTNGGSVRGTVDKCTSGVVLLIPQDPALQSLGFLRSASCDASGRYQFTAVRPGEYYALAFAGVRGIPQLNDVLLSQASKITIRATETTTADLPVIPEY